MFINEHRDRWPIRVMCHVLKVSHSGYYAWRKRPEPEDSPEQRQLLQRIRVIFKQSKKSAGTRRIVKALRESGEIVGRYRVRRLMRQDRLVAKRTPRFKPSTTDSKHEHAISPNLLDRKFNPVAPNAAWSADITYIKTLRGFVYLAVVMELHSRRIIGWCVSDDMTQQLVIKALWHAWVSRGRPKGVLIHSDRGRQYASKGYRKMLTKRMSCIQSMSRKGNCWDNAPVESFFSTLKIEGFEGLVFRDADDVASHAWQFIEIYYNNKRMHSTLNYVSPCQHEASYIRKQEQSLNVCPF